MKDNICDKLGYAKRIAVIMNIILLMIHVGLLLMFLSFRAYLMVGVNIISILTYIGCMFLLKKDKVKVYFYIAYCEIAIHMVLATISMGWDFGFQNYCFSLIPVSFLCEYGSGFSGARKIKVHSIVISIVTVLIFLVARFYTYKYEPLYVIQNKYIVYAVYMANVFCTFWYLTTYMSCYIKFIVRMEKTLNKMATVDALTGLYNRHYMQEYLSATRAEAMKLKESFTVGIIDIDDFKTINDTYGHNIGDYVLYKVAKILRQSNTDNISIARWGGEEFIIVQTAPYDSNQCYEQLEAIRKEVAETKFNYQDKDIQVTVTGGIATFENEMSVEQMIQRADERLYIGKRTGKNRVINR